MATAPLTIWVVDDEAAMRSLLSDFLNAEGYRVASFSAPSEVLTAMRNGPAPQAILSDIRMYPMDGIGLLQIAKRDFPTIPILLYTGNGCPEEGETCLRLGAAVYLTKPFPLLLLKKTLAEVLGPLISKAK